MRLIASIVLLAACATAQAADSFAISKDAASFLERHCVQCHSGDAAEADVRFDNLPQLDLEARLDLLNRAHEQLHFGTMPPESEEQPAATDRAKLVNWIVTELRKHNAGKLEDKLRRPEYGNYVDHHDLFSGEYAHLKGFTYDRRWLISEYIFDAKFNRIVNHNPGVNIDGKRQYVIGSNNRRLNLTNPFLLPTNSGVRYYAYESLNGGHLLTMMTNAKEVSSYMVYLATRDSRYVPAIAEIMAQEWQHEKTLTSRESFLNQFVDVVLADLYQDKHATLLPQFVPVEVEPIAPVDGHPIKKAPYHAANPGPQEVELIYRTMQKHEAESGTYEQLIENCEREWFNFGHNERKIHGRVTFLINYEVEFRQQMEQHGAKYKPYIYKPLSDGEMAVIADTIRKHRAAGDRYVEVIDKCMSQWEAEFKQQRIDAGPPHAELVAQLVDQLFIKLLERSPTPEERDQYASLSLSYVANMGNRKAIEKLIQTLILRSDFVYRNEFGQGQPDEHGRTMLSPRDASYAIAYALTDSSPDEELTKAAEEGRLSSREDFEREVRRMLARRDQYYIIDESVDHSDLPNFTNMPIRELRFVREFFGYPNMLSIFKDNKRFGGQYDKTTRRVVAEADRLVENIIETDHDVFETLLTTDKFYVYHSGDNEAMQTGSDRIKKIYDYFKDKGWRDFELEDLRPHADFIAEMQMRGIDAKRLSDPKGRYNPLNAFKQQMESFELRLSKGQTAAAPYPSFPAHGFSNAWNRYRTRMEYPEVARMFNIDMTNWDYPTQQPAKIEHRKGMLTHPAWLIAHAGNTETDPIHRGKWVREKLLAGTIPDLPITVDAVIPEDPHKTLRQRLDLKTNNDYCLKCHQKMNPIGLPFEIYDDFGRYRTEERLEYPENLVEKVKDKGAPHEDLRDIYKTLPVDARGYLDGTGDPGLDGEVSDALDMIDRLARSDRVRQSIIRHAFRYFMGRNEMLSDSKTLIDADRAYLESGGSFDELIVSLLTSDSFIYRKAREN